METNLRLGHLLTCSISCHSYTESVEGLCVCVCVSQVMYALHCSTRCHGVSAGKEFFRQLTSYTAEICRVGRVFSTYSVVQLFNILTDFIRE